MANKFVPWIDTTSPLTIGVSTQSQAVFAQDEQRKVGFVAGDPASAIRVNSALRQANVVVAALMQLADELKTLPDLDLNSSVASIAAGLKASIITPLTTRLTNLEDSFEEISGDAVSLGQRITTLENEMDAVQSKNTQQDTSISGLSSRMSAAESDIDALQTSEGDILPVENGGTGATSLEDVKVGSANTADSAVADGEGNEIPKTYAKATIVPVRWNGGYWSSYGGQSAKAGDLALIINNTGSTAYQKGCLYKVSSASGSSMSLSPTKIAGLVSSMAVNDDSGTSISDMFRAIANTLQDECVTISQDEYPIQLAVRGSIENKNILVFNDSSGSTKKRFVILSFRMLFDLGNAKVMSGTTIATHHMTLNKTHRCFGPIDYNDPIGRCIVVLDINPDGSIKIYFSTGDNTNSQSFRLNSMNFDNVVIIFDEGEYL